MKTDRNHDEIKTRSRQPRSEFRAVAWVCVVVVLVTLSACFGSFAKALPPSNSERAREIIDPCLGTRWRLQADAAHPGWPARLVLVTTADGRNAIAGGQAAIGVARVAIVDRRSAISVPQIAIHVGDRIELEQENGLVRARFETLALEPAGIGQVLKVRFMSGSFGEWKSGRTSFGGSTASAVALGPGRARWLAWDKVAR